jgi:hypothetical protein
VREATRRAYATQEAEAPKLGVFALLNVFKRDDAPMFSARPQVLADRRIRQFRGAPDKAPRFELLARFENVDLVALTLFGVALVAIGAFLAFNGASVDVIAGAAVAGPGLAAAGIGGYGLWRGVPESANA